MSNVEDLKERYNQLSHAMQTGVAFSIEFEEKNIQPKHLMTGINASLVEVDALSALLVAKEIFTKEEVANSDFKPISSRRLREGINQSMIETGAIAFLLLEKGIFSEEEYFQCLCDFMQQEVESYVQRFAAQGINLRIV